MHISETILVILDKLIYDSRYVKGRCFTLNEMLIKLASLIICSINDNFTNTLLTFPPKVKKNSAVYSTFIILCTQQKPSFIGNLMIKLLAC